MNLVEEAIVAEHGDYTNYRDDDLEQLVAAGAGVLEVEPRDLSRHLGRVAIQGMVTRYPHYFAAHDSTPSFLKTLDALIHGEVRRLYPEAVPPEFWFEEPGGTVLGVHHRSVRRHCALAEGILEGAAAHFDERVSITHESYMHDGAAHCTMRVAVEGG